MLGWPTPDSVIHPQGAGAAVFAKLVREKIGGALQRLPQAKDAQVGVLMANPDASTSEPPMAIVAEFKSEIDSDSLRELHRLSWNFSHAPTVITIEPTLMRVWSCCEAPDPELPIDSYLVKRLPATRLEVEDSDNLEVRAAQALHWINLVSGQFFSENSSRFDRDGRADQMLLMNLRFIRNELVKQGLVNDDICHDLLARVVFVQFLLDRKDQDGNSALTVSMLHRLQNDGILEHIHSTFYSILLDYDDAYRLFDWLNAKFNGDLFPGKGNSRVERENGWMKEKEFVKARHLTLLADFIRGDLDMPKQQGCLWPQYAFDVIPLEFISSIYETFVTDRATREGIYYTPPYLVDFVLDRVLPWDGEDWDLKIIDPACGSGIFLVKAFQRLVHRWKLANQGIPLRAKTLRYLLEHNIFGVDKDPHAVRVACFSLYLAMCDEIEPRHYWTEVSFPPMRQRRLVFSDFFRENQKGFKTNEDAETYDLVVGNAPFGADTITKHAEAWATSDDRNWSIPNRDIGGLFLAKGAQLSSNKGRVALIQSANTLLFNIRKASDFRRELFLAHRVETIFNLAALRSRLFRGKKHTKNQSAAPVCLVILRSEKSSLADSIEFISPKHLRPLADEFTIVIEPYDQRSLTVEEAISDPQIWPKLMWGKPRDLQLIEKLQSFPSLKKMEASYAVKSRVGINFGDRKKSAHYLDGRKFLNENKFPPENTLSLETDDLPIIDGLRLHSRDSTNFEAFAWPQLIIKRSWIKGSFRFQARLNQSSNEEGIVFNRNYISVHTEKPVLEAACVSHNSKIAVYFHFLTSGRFAAYRPVPSKDEMLKLPIPFPASDLLDGMENYSSLDERAFDLFELKEAERVLIEDAIEFTLGDYVNGNSSKGRQPTSFGDASGNDLHLRSYCKYFLRVLKAGFGNERQVSATVFRCLSESMPYRLVAFALGGIADNEIELKNIESTALLKELEQLNRKAIDQSNGTYNQRVARIYEVRDRVPIVFIIKPNQKRFWTRSMGLHDGDEVALDLFRWQQEVVVKDEGTLH